MLRNPVREVMPVVLCKAVMLLVEPSHDAIEVGFRAIPDNPLFHYFLDGFPLPEVPAGDRASLLQFHEEAVSKSHTVFVWHLHNLIDEVFHFVK